MTAGCSTDCVERDAIIISAPRVVRTERLSVPHPKEDELLVRVELCGICTPEQRVYRGTKPIYPYWGGHEVCGILEYVPPASDKRMLRGGRVALALMRRCGKCCACQNALDNHCAYVNPTLPDGLPAGPRGFAQYLSVPVYKAFAVPDWLPPEKTVLAEPLACTLHSVRQAAPRSGEIAVVIGAGTMGLLHTIVLTTLGCRVLLFDQDATTRDAAVTAGASFFGRLEVLSDPNHLRSLTNNWGPHLIFCTRFGSRAIEVAIQVAARGGRIVLYQSIGNFHAITFDSEYFHYRELRLIGTIAQKADDMVAAVELLTKHPNRFDCLHVEIIPATRPADAFERALCPAINRVLVDFRN